MGLKFIGEKMQQWLLLGAGRLHEFVLKELYFFDVLLPAHNRSLREFFNFSYFMAFSSTSFSFSEHNIIKYSVLPCCAQFH
jgi:hypothetical protein